MADWDRRQLCPDGACIGLIGDDGLCKVCGKEGASGLGPRASGREQDADDEDETDEDETDEDETSEETDAEDAASSPEARGPKPEAPSATPDSWDSRQLCRDESCIGVLGEDGKCKVCGK